MPDLPDDRLNDLWPLDADAPPVTIKLDAHAAAFPAPRREPRQRRPHAAASALYSNTGKRKMAASQPVETNNPRPMIALINWRPRKNNTLRGFVDVRLPFGSIGLIIKDITVHRKEARVWIGLPQRPVINQDGTARRDGSGKIQYSSIIEWQTREAADRFSAKVIELIEFEHPGATA